ncbi:MAG: fumarate hydratase [bacterium (Candidatus Ratteibacteria) CG_4_9_14_3_um_filter_41_21]|uniref:Fumarate hydratase n=2 Tax=Candidatus Ratteibacteria TaxID=2979319 RepID=A0A2M7YH84_9BACT|nr:MAG: fumarate hydratase [Candidatus Omnitrophica bacterium CG1_02_41_171]PIW73827.1 MAG: fumarate hydratase [bacterium (Candidatus Ratteibacteria) CG_4_8_14_3_um_filter_41_36]PJA62332.1 MAG: fumarate hydratase [bacterium (Candidatus Ratteibacteria) CG_4_9_14_3_um_filter_41_21]HCG77289.1 TRZ/ATZ family protein [bacterium]
MKTKRIFAPLTSEGIKKLETGDEVLLSGIIYTARDAAHQRMTKNLKKLPFDLKGQIIYYTGPTPPSPGKIIGSCGPTTSYRMDPYTPSLLKLGLKGTIGKGERSQEVKEAIKRYSAVYFIAFGGCGALYSQFIKKTTLIAYLDLGCESILKLEVEDFPLLVGIDACGRDIYQQQKT